MGRARLLETSSELGTGAKTLSEPETLKTTCQNGAGIELPSELQSKF